jgi:virginiamycin B lyase
MLTDDFPLSCFNEEHVMKNTHRLMSSIGLAALVALANDPAHAQTALSGKVSSAREGAMEGVVVSAKKDGSTITISVVTDAQGRYQFPAERLQAGHYTLAARASGYDVDGHPSADVGGGKDAVADLSLKTTSDLAAQLNNAEWLLSMPGTDQQKNFLLNCNSCHTLERIVKSKYDADGFLDVFKRMSGYYPGSTPERPQHLVGSAVRTGLAQNSEGRKTAEWLASVNLSQQDKWSWPLKTLPRLTGKSTKVIITEYDLPDASIQPHDVILDKAGQVWYSDFGQMFIGKMDPVSGKVTQFPIPESKVDFPKGTLDLETDANDDIWVGVMYQGAIGKFDRASGTFKQWTIPKEFDADAGQLGHLAVTGTHVDNKVWIKNSDGNNIYRLDLTTNKIENFGQTIDPATKKRFGSYGIHSDKLNNLYLLDYSAGNIGRIDGKTKELKVFATPTPNSRPRRGRVDEQGRLWFAEYQGHAIAMLDPAKETVTEWKVPTPWSAPYDAMVGKNGDAWAGSMLTDRVARLNVASSEYVEYPLPRPTNIRRVFVDDSRSPSVLWVGSNHGASIVKVEPLERE